jgi:hypothetical protein
MRALSACVSVRRCRAPLSLPSPSIAPYGGYGGKVKIGSVHFGLFAVSSLFVRFFVAEAKAERVKDKSGVLAVRRAPLPSPSPCPLPFRAPCAVAVPSPRRRRAVAVPPPPQRKASRSRNGLPLSLQALRFASCVA